MKYIRMLVVLLGLVIFICVSGNTAEKEKTAEPISEKDSVSYVIGINIGRSLMNVGGKYKLFVPSDLRKDTRQG